MNTMMNNEIATERIRSRSHTPRAGRNRRELDCSDAGWESSAVLFSDSVLGVSGMPLSYCIQIAATWRSVAANARINLLKARVKSLRPLDAGNGWERVPIT